MDRETGWIPPRSRGMARCTIGAYPQLLVIRVCCLVEVFLMTTDTFHWCA